jgi:hypothetical protein
MAKKVKKRDFTLADLGDISSASDDESSTVKSGGGVRSMSFILRAPSNLEKLESRDLDGYASVRPRTSWTRDVLWLSRKRNRAAFSRWDWVRPFSEVS